MKRCLRKTVLSIKVSLSLNHLKTREIGSFKRERYLCASAIRVDLRLVAETAVLRGRVMTRSCLEAQHRGATRGQSLPSHDVAYYWNSVSLTYRGLKQREMVCSRKHPRGYIQLHTFMHSGPQLGMFTIYQKTLHTCTGSRPQLGVWKLTDRITERPQLTYPFLQAKEAKHLNFNVLRMQILPKCQVDCYVDNCLVGPSSLKQCTASPSSQASLWSLATKDHSVWASLTII